MKSQLGVGLAGWMIACAMGCGGRAEVAPSDGDGAGLGGAGAGVGIGGTGGVHAEGGAGGDAGSGGTPSVGGSGGDGGSPPQSFCEDACAKTAGSCFPPDSCTLHCEEHGGDWPPVVQEAFALCAAENPLCFQTVDSCMLGVLHPVGSTYELRVEGSGLDAFEGLQVIIWVEVLDLGAEATVEGGAFSVEWTALGGFWGRWGPGVMVYIDVDANGACGSPDVAEYDGALWNGDFLAPVFTATIDMLDPDPSFVCGFVP